MTEIKKHKNNLLLNKKTSNEFLACRTGNIMSSMINAITKQGHGTSLYTSEGFSSVPAAGTGAAGWRKAAALPNTISWHRAATLGRIWVIVE